MKVKIFQAVGKEEIEGLEREINDWLKASNLKIHHTNTAAASVCEAGGSTEMYQNAHRLRVVRGFKVGQYPELQMQCQPPNKQLQRTVERCRGHAASVSFHYALAARSNPQRAAAELRL